MEVNVSGYVMPADQVARMTQLRRGVAKARRIRRILEEEIGPAPWPARRVLDIGCGPGVIAAALAKCFGFVVGVDIDGRAVDLAETRFGSRPNLKYKKVTNLPYPFEDGSFDVLIINHVYEHAADVGALFGEARRLLAPGGVIYLAAAGKYQPIEPHYHLPFLSWLPRRLANLYLHLAGRAENYDVRLLSWRRLFRFLAAFQRKEYTAWVLREARRYAAAEGLPSGWRAKLAATVLEVWPGLAPTRILILRPLK